MTKINSPIDIERFINYDDLDFQEDCDEDLWKKIKEIYDEVASLIEKCDDAFMKMSLDGHVKMFEDRSDWDECQKTVRRKRLIIEWHNFQMSNLKKEKENESNPDVVATDS
jgi:hypothetical protein